ncbi:MAG: nitrous oxide reductase accessory protein NosL [Flavobacteriaceae bacterium]
MKKYILLFLSFSFILSCNVAPKEIKYGQDHCYHCDMTVVDKTHAAQYVTKKGRSYAFDAAECLIWKLQKENNEDQMAFILVTDYNRPETLIEAKSAIYLISEKIKSPMSANLSAFKSEEEAQKALKEYGGKLYNWDEIKTQLAR